MRRSNAVLPAAAFAAWAFLLLPLDLPAAAADPSLGRRLFSGEIPFRGGGAPCAACHRLNLLPDGGSLGPDLGKVFGDYGAESLDGVLADLSFPSMKLLYGGRPLTADERAHLTAFFAEAAAAGAAPPGDRLLLHGLGGALALLAIAAIAGRKRLREVRRALLRESHGPEGGTR